MSIRETKKKKTKKAILDSAISLFSRNGYEHTSIEQIATVAGVGKGTVYSYFHTKKDIIKGFCEYELEEIHSELVTNANHDDSILKQMLTIYLTVFRYVTKNKEFGRIYLREAVFPDDNGIRDDHEIDNKYFQMLFPILEKGQERGELRDDLELLHITAHFYSLYLVIISAWYTGRIGTEDVAPTMGDLFRQALEGLRPPTRPKIDNEKDND